MDLFLGLHELRRYPHRPRAGLRAWDAADEYLADHVRTEVPDGPDPRWLLLNDGFGALAVAIAPVGSASMSDSWLSRQGARENLLRHGRSPDDVVWLSSLDGPPWPADVVLVKVPKTLALLEDELHRIRPALTERTVVVGAGMTRAVHTSTLETFERLVGPTTTSRATKKARLIFADVDPDLDPGPSPFPTHWMTAAGLRVVDHANVFSRGRLDGGTRLLLEGLAAAPPASALAIVDLGCGSGILGTTLATADAEADVVFVDESFHAVASAEATYGCSGGRPEQAAFVVAGDLASVATASRDLVVTNPSFHEHRARGDDVAWQMFADAHRVLRPGGELWVVGNRHLGYHAKLARRFGTRPEVIASDRRFVVLRVRR